MRYLWRAFVALGAFASLLQMLDSGFVKQTLEILNIAFNPLYIPDFVVFSLLLIISILIFVIPNRIFGIVAITIVLMPMLFKLIILSIQINQIVQSYKPLGISEDRLLGKIEFFPLLLKFAKWHLLSVIFVGLGLIMSFFETNGQVASVSVRPAAQYDHQETRKPTKPPTVNQNQDSEAVTMRYTPVEKTLRGLQVILEEDNIVNMISGEVRIGRSSKWSNFVVPDKYNMVSRKHLKIVPISKNKVRIEHMGRFSSKIVSPFTRLIRPGESVGAQRPLTIELVAGHGPRVSIL